MHAILKWLFDSVVLFVRMCVGAMLLFFLAAVAAALYGLMQSVLMMLFSVSEAAYGRLTGHDRSKKIQIEKWDVDKWQ
jgi:hypothetical protein